MVWYYSSTYSKTPQPEAVSSKETVSLVLDFEIFLECVSYRISTNDDLENDIEN